MDSVHGGEYALTPGCTMRTSTLQVRQHRRLTLRRTRRPTRRRDPRSLAPLYYAQWSKVRPCGMNGTSDPSVARVPSLCVHRVHCKGDQVLCWRVASCQGCAGWDGGWFPLTAGNVSDDPRVEEDFFADRGCVGGVR